MTVVLFKGHAVELLDGLPAEHFHTVVTSPPYWKLRAYGTPPQTWADGWSGELGQEESPEGYLAHLLEVFASVRRVLRDDGTLWVNLAGCYWNDPGGQNGSSHIVPVGAGSVLHPKAKEAQEPGRISRKAIQANAENGRHEKGKHPWLKALDWVDVPGLFARAMQQAGWLWRSDVVWVKPSALPESVSGTRWERCRVKVAEAGQPRRREATESKARGGHPEHHHRDVPTLASEEQRSEWADCPGCPKCAPTDGLVLRRGNGRPTKATERVLLFAKKPGYFWDADAVREPNTAGAIERFAKDGSSPPRDKFQGWDGRSRAAALAYGTEWRGNGHSVRDVWTITSEPLTDAHYAAYPTALPERCIKAGTSEWGCCPACGAPWARVVDRGDLVPDAPGYKPRGLPASPDGLVHVGMTPSATGGVSAPNHHYESTTLGWRPTCRCQPEQPPVPCRVLDPFGGSGSTGLAANRLGRDATLVELKPAYADLARKRLGREPLSLFAYERPEEATV